jgi:hypothetical protein
MRMRHIVIFGLPGSTIFFPRYLINCAILEKELQNTKCVFWFPLQLLPETFLILSRIERDKIKKYLVVFKYPLFLSDFNETCVFSTAFEKYSNFMKILATGAELFHAVRRMDRHDDANSRFSQFCERS